MGAKVSVIGAGSVGASTAMRLVEKDVADVVMLDVVEGLAQGKALDIMHSAAVEGFTRTVVGTGDYRDTAGSDVVVVTAGVARKPGMSREDLLFTNARIVSEVVRRVIEHSPDAVLVMVTNPLDVMAYLAYVVSGLPAPRVVGMAGILDGARFSHLASRRLGVAPSDVHALVLGSHGDLMVPLPEACTVGGVPLTDMLSPEDVEEIRAGTRDAGARIVKLLGSGSAYYAPSSAAAAMVKSILRDERRVYPCSVLLDGNYGLRDVFLGVPVVLGRGGVERIVEMKLSGESMQALQAAASAVREGIERLRREGMLP